MKNQKIKIGDEVFDLKTGKYVFLERCNSLLECYTKPSIIKQSIYQAWMEWFYKNSESANDCICIRSFDTYKFTLNGFITNNGAEYYFLITSTRTEIYEK